MKQHRLSVYTYRHDQSHTVIYMDGERILDLSPQRTKALLKALIEAVYELSQLRHDAPIAATAHETFSEED